jgi:hypothetical protein
VELRDEIALLAAERGGTMLDIVTDAVHRLSRDQWWDSVHYAPEGMTADECEAYGRGPISSTVPRPTVSAQRRRGPSGTRST